MTARVMEAEKFPGQPQTNFALIVNFSLMITDEREESLREVSALGNIKAVNHYIHAGVNVNAANKMNNW